MCAARRPDARPLSLLGPTSLVLTSALALSALALAGCQDDAGGIGRVAGKISTDELIDFGTVQVGLLAPYDLEVKNTGNVAVKVTGIEVGEGFAVDGVYEFDLPRAPFSIAPQETKRLRVTFQPLQAMDAAVESSFTVVTDIRSENATDLLRVNVRVRGRGARSGLLVEPNPVEFGGVLVGASRTLDVKITNALSVPIDVFSEVGSDGRALVTTQGGHGRFEILSELHGTQGSLLPNGMKLDPNTSITVQAMYTPDPGETNRTDFGRWVIKNCDNPLCEVEVRMGGHGTNTGLECAPAVIEFGDINPGRTATRPITCTNVSTGEITVTNWSMAAGSASELSVSTYPGGLPVVGPGQTFNIDASFSPTRATLGVHATGTVVIATRSDSAMRDLDPAQVQLSGTGGGPTIGVSPSLLDFGQVALNTTYTKRLLLQNTGYSDLVVTMIVPDGTDASQFMPSLGAITLATGTSTVVDVTFAPTMAGPLAADLSFVSNDGSTPDLRVPMRGIGVDLPPCDYNLQPSSVAYGVVPVRETQTQTVRITNQGQFDCLVNDVALAGDNAFTLENGNETGVLIPPGTTHDLPIDFTPVRSGNFSGTLGFYISSPAASMPTVPLFGVGLAQTEIQCPAPITTPAGVPVTLTANVTTQGTSVTGYEWAITSAPTGGIGTPNQWAPDPPTAQTETFLPYIVGAYVITITVYDSNGDAYQCDTQVVAEGHGLRVQLTWDGTGDLDLHVHNQTVTPWFTNPDDCYYADRTPLWNPAQQPAVGENPQLDFDNVTASGPENTRVDTVVVGQPYTIAVHNFARGAGRTATLDVFCGGVTTPTQTFISPILNGGDAGNCTTNDFWKVATVVFTSQTSCTVTPINVVGQSSTYCNQF